MAHIIIPTIESRAKIAALIGLSITSLIAIMSQKIYMGLSIPIEIFWALALLGGFYFALELLTYVRFYIEKMLFIKEQKTISEIKILEIEVECKRLELQISLKRVEGAVI